MVNFRSVRSVFLVVYFGFDLLKGERCLLGFLLFQNRNSSLRNSFSIKWLQEEKIYSVLSFSELNPSRLKLSIFVLSSFSSFHISSFSSFQERSQIIFLDFESQENDGRDL